MKAVVLAAGKGTRLKGLSDRCAKPMVRVNGRPLLEWILERIAGAGIHEFVIVTGYLGHQIEEYFGDGDKQKWRIRYVPQSEQNGTGGALNLCRGAVGSDLFFLSYGDIIASEAHYGRLVQSFHQSPCDALLTLQWVEDPYRGGAIYVDENNRVERVVEKPPHGTSTTNWNNGGMFVLTPEIFDYTARLPLSPRGEYELTDAVTAMVADGRVVRGLPLDGYRCDLSTPEDVARMEAVLSREENRGDRP